MPDGNAAEPAEYSFDQPAVAFGLELMVPASPVRTADCGRHIIDSWFG